MEVEAQSYDELQNVVDATTDDMRITLEVSRVASIREASKMYTIIEPRVKASTWQCGNFIAIRKVVAVAVVLIDIDELIPALIANPKDEDAMLDLINAAEMLHDRADVLTTTKQLRGRMSNFGKSISSAVTKVKEDIKNISCLVDLQNRVTSLLDEVPISFIDKVRRQAETVPKQTLQVPTQAVEPEGQPSEEIQMVPAVQAPEERHANAEPRLGDHEDQDSLEEEQPEPGLLMKTTKQGRIHKVIREHHLRDDIYCGFVPCSACPAAATDRKLDAAAAAILVVDTNVVLHQIDLLENPAIEDVVVLSVVLDEVKNKNVAIFNRIEALCTNKERRFYVFANHRHRDTYIKDMVGESSNDRNDRAIRVAACWYQSHLGESVKVLLITNDRDNKRKAIEEGLNAETVESYVRSLAQPGLLDLVVVPTSAPVTMEDAEGHRPSKKKVIYNEHKPMSEITSGLRCGIYHQGKLRVNRYNPFEAYVGSESIEDEIVIRGCSNMNRAFEGDIVAVELLPQDQWHKLKSSVGSSAPSVSSRPVGHVVGIIKRNSNLYCGSLEPITIPRAHALFVSKDQRIPKIRIQTSQLENLVNKRIVVAIDSWDVFSRYPSGHYVRTIGDIGDKETETEIILIENDINTRPFSTQVLACLPPLPWTLSPGDLANPNRQDLRHVRVFSVDPPGCRDIDDALHCTLLPNGNFEVGVHIADVTNFVHPGTPLDEEAAQRGTSVYVVGHRIDMLPKPLTEDVCSLCVDVERLAFSIIWEMTPEADIISTRYTKSVIKSCAAMSYVEAQARMDDSRLVDPLTVDLRNLNSLAKIMRQRRCDRGALPLESAEIKFEIDSETHDPLDIGIYQIREANQMIEEFMLAANISVAEKILMHFPSCSLLRRHPSPTKEMLERLLRISSSVGLNLDVSSSKALAESLDNAKVMQSNDPYFNKLIRIMVARCMTQAIYFCSGDLTFSEYYHYGLAASCYTHFTSPIRRYADVVVHRLLAAALEIAKLPPIFQDGPQLTGIADNLNYRECSDGKQSVS